MPHLNKRVYKTNPFQWHIILMWVIVLLIGGCQSESDRSDNSPAILPLQPLIYTEYPDMTPQAAAARERRLMRQLLEGSTTSGEWGHLDDGDVAEFPAISSPDALGRAIFEALISQNDGLWDHIFVAPSDYANLVHVSMDTAQSFVDDLVGQSNEVWTAFGAEQSSEVRSGGLAALFQYEGLKLGRGRTIHGPPARDASDIAQYWGNILEMRFGDTDLLVELPIPKIIHVLPTSDNHQQQFAVASEIQKSSKLEMLQRLGMHLKTELLRSHEYPYPLKVGNFWRYRRRLVDIDNSTPDASDESDKSNEAALEQLWEGAVELDASEVIVEVVSVERHQAFRLVEMQRSYNNQNLSQYTDHWLITPRQIWRCPAVCRDKFQDLGWLLTYLSHQTPLFQFPFVVGQQWGSGGKLTAGTKVRDSWQPVQTPAGVFHAPVILTGNAIAPQVDRPIVHYEQERYFAPQKGVVKQVLKGKDADQSEVLIVEELIEYRIIP